MATNEAIVAAAQQLYVSYYGRPADPEGLAFWIDFFTNSTDVDEALAAFGESDEYLALIDGLTTEETITQLYQFMFNRDPDAEGLAFYTDLLDSGEATLASIALDVANGAQNADITILNNKVSVANTFTAEVEAESAEYNADDIAGAQAVLADVGESEESVTAGNAAAQSFVSDLPKFVAGGEYTLDEDNATGDFSAATDAVTVILDGDSDEAAFDVTLSVNDDTVVLEELKSAAITDSGGTDTLDTSEHSGRAVVSLLAGTFTMVDGSEQFKGTVDGIENVIGTDNNDTITGDNNDNWIWGGEGNDTLKGGIGDDYFVFEDESEVGTGTADGQTGTDTVVFTSDDVDLSGIGDNHLAVETLMLSNADGEDEVSLTLAAAGSASIGADSFSKIVGSDAVDTVAVVGNINVSTVAIEDVEVLAAAGNARTVTINSGTGGLALVGNAQAGAATTNNGILALAGGGSFDLSTLSLSGFRAYQGSASTSTFENVVLNQAALDAALDAALFTAGANPVLQQNHVFTNLNNASTSGSDSVTLSGSVDFTSFVEDRNIDFRSLVFGEGDTVLFNDLSATGIRSITGSDSESDTLVVIPEGTAQNYSSTGTNLSISGVETLLVDILSGNEGLNVTIDENTLSGVSTITGEIDLIVAESAKAETIANLDGIEVTEAIDLSSAGAGQQVSVTQSVLDGFQTFASNGPLELVMGGDLTIDASHIASATVSALLGVAGGGTSSVMGSSADESLTIEGTLVGNGNLLSDEGGAGFSVSLGAGNDTLTAASGAVAGNVDMGSGNNTVLGVVAGNLDLGDNSSKVKGANDGTNTVVGLVTGNITGGDGSDNVSVGGVLNTTGASNFNDGDDSLTGISGLNPANATNLGVGNDTFTSAGAHLGGILLSPVTGGSGNDTFNINNGSLTVTGGSGNDVFTLSALAFGATITDLNVGAKDEFYIDIVGAGHTTTVAKMSTNTMFGTTTNTMTFLTTTTTTVMTTYAYTFSKGSQVYSNTTGTSTTGTGSRMTTFTTPNGVNMFTATTKFTGTWVATSTNTTASTTVSNSKAVTTSTTTSGAMTFFKFVGTGLTSMPTAMSTVTGLTKTRIVSFNSTSAPVGTMTATFTATMTTSTNTYETPNGGTYATTNMYTLSTTSTTSMPTSMSTTTFTNAGVVTSNSFTVASGNFGFVSGTEGTTDSALAAAVTDDGGLRILNQQGQLVTIAPGEALGTTVALPTFASYTALKSFLTMTASAGGIGTSMSGVRPALADTSYVVFAFTTAPGAATSANLVGYLVTAAASQSGTVTAREVSTVTIATIATQGLSASDIVLI